MRCFNKMGIRDKVKKGFEKIVETGSNRLGKMPDFSRVRLEVYIYAYLVLAFFGLIISQGFIHNTVQTVIFSIGLFGSLAQFISKSNLYRKLKFMQEIKNATNKSNQERDN